MSTSLGLLNGVVTAAGLAFFIGIVYWAFSKARASANDEAAYLPFALPDESTEAAP